VRAETESVLDFFLRKKHRLERRRFPLGNEIPLLWKQGVEWSFASSAAAAHRTGGHEHGQEIGGKATAGGNTGGDEVWNAQAVAGFGVGEECVVKRSDGKLKFGVIKSCNAQVCLGGGNCVCGRCLCMYATTVRDSLSGPT